MSNASAGQRKRSGARDRGWVGCVTEVSTQACMPTSKHVPCLVRIWCREQHLVAAAPPVPSMHAGAPPPTLPAPNAAPLLRKRDVVVEGGDVGQLAAAGSGRDACRLLSFGQRQQALRFLNCDPDKPVNLIPPVLHLLRFSAAALTHQAAGCRTGGVAVAPPAAGGAGCAAGVGLRPAGCRLPGRRRCSAQRGAAPEEARRA